MTQLIDWFEEERHSSAKWFLFKAYIQLVAGCTNGDILKTTKTEYMTKKKKEIKSFFSICWPASWCWWSASCCSPCGPRASRPALRPWSWTRPAGGDREPTVRWEFGWGSVDSHSALTGLVSTWLWLWPWLDLWPPTQKCFYFLFKSWVGCDTKWRFSLIGSLRLTQLPSHSIFKFFKTTSCFHHLYHVLGASTFCSIIGSLAIWFRRSLYFDIFQKDTSI